MKIKYNHFLLALSALILVSCSGEKELKDGWENFSTSTYSINYPEEWELDDSGEMGTEFMILSPKEGDEDLFRENVNLVVQNLGPKAMDLSQFVQLSEGQLKTMITDLNIISSVRKESKGLTYHDISYVGTQGIYELRVQQYYWVENKNVYVLTMTTEDKNYKKFSDVCKEIMASFELTL